MDKETTKILTEVEQLHYLVKGDGWNILKTRLKNLLDKQGLRMEDIQDKPDDEVARLLRTRLYLQEFVQAFIDEIEGDAERHPNLKDSFSNEDDDIIINS